MTHITRSLLALAGLLVLSQGQAQATQYPYCLHQVEAFGGGVERCDYTSMAQCQMSSSGMGGSCYANWRLALNKAQGRDIIQPDGSKKPARY